ncbi:MAG: TolC family protein [Deltaproteobacteria bacterium]|nr:TolC family protein [Deltaproteobacteria bacterium]
MILSLALALATAAAPAPTLERITFDEAVRRAQARAPAARIAADEIARVDGLLTQARSFSLPLLTASGTWSRIDHDRILRRTPPTADQLVTPQEQRGAAAVLQVPLLAPSRWATWVVASRTLDLTRVSGEDVRRQVALAAGRAYLGVLASGRAVEVTRSAVELARARLDFSGARLKAGVGNALDQARSEQVLAASEAQLETVQTGLTRAREALGLVTGSEQPLDAGPEPALEVPAAAAGEVAVDRRSDVAVARARFEAAAAAARYSWADWLPSLVATAQATHQHPVVAPSQPEAWQVQLVLSLPIFEGGLRVGQLQERRAVEREAQTLLDATLRQARSDVRLAVEAAQHQEAAFLAARRAAEQARTVLSLITRAYEAGATTSLDLTTAQQQSRDADLAMVISEDALRQARLDLLSAVGLFP